MEILIGITAFLASLLTLFSGFGLGTLLMPVFGLFFPVPLAIALTGVVHLLNNLFKLSLMYRHASRDMILRFGVPSLLGGLAGALVLVGLSGLPVLFRWQWDGHLFEVSYLKLVVALLMIVFALLEALPILKLSGWASRYLSAGGLLSGFFGGLSGHQGALRSAFLIQCGLSKEQYIATGVVIATMVDGIRLPVYFNRFASGNAVEQWPVLLVATLCAFAGAYIGTRYLHKVTLRLVQWITSVMILTVALLLGSGIL